MFFGAAEGRHFLFLYMHEGFQNAGKLDFNQPLRLPRSLPFSCLKHVIRDFGIFQPFKESFKEEESTSSPIRKKSISRFVGLSEFRSGLADGSGSRFWFRRSRNPPRGVREECFFLSSHGRRRWCQFARVPVGGVSRRSRNPPRAR